MTERDEDKAELEAAREAVRIARMSAVRADVAVEAIHRSSAEIRTIVEANGYLERFRRVLRGAH